MILIDVFVKPFASQLLLHDFIARISLSPSISSLSVLCVPIEVLVLVFNSRSGFLCWSWFRAVLVRKSGYTLMYSIGSGCLLFETGRETRPGCLSKTTSVTLFL